MFDLLTRIANPIHVLILRSPFHRLVSDTIILLTFYGRKSGRRFTIPVNYARVGGDIRFFSKRSRRWWLNLMRGTWVRIRLQGKEYDGIAEHIPANHARMVEALCAFYHGISREDAEHLADQLVMFHIHLATASEEVRRKAPQAG